MTNLSTDRLDRVIRTAVHELVAAAPAAAPLIDGAPGRPLATLPNRPRRAWMALAVTAVVALIAAGIAWVEGRGSSAPAVEPTSPVSQPSPTDGASGVPATAPADGSAPNGTDPAVPTTAFPPTAGSDAGADAPVWVPAVLPAGWVVWNAGAAAMPTDGAHITEQLFGVRDPETGEFAPGLLVKVSDLPATLGDPAGNVGGADAFWVDVGVIDGAPEVLTWSDGTLRYDVGGVGLDWAEMLVIAQSLEFGPDPLDGALVTSVPGELPLVEQWRRPDAPSASLVYWASPPGGPDLGAGAAFPAQDSGVVRIRVGASSWPGVPLPPETSLLGTLRRDGVEDLVPTWFAGRVIGRMPDGAAVLVEGDATTEELSAVLHGLRAVSPADAIAAIRLDDSPLRTLPEQASATFTGTGAGTAVTVSVRGSAVFDAAASEQVDWYGAICLEETDALRCRLAWPTLDPLGPAGHLVATVTIAGRRYVVGADVGSDASVAVVPWAARTEDTDTPSSTVHIPLGDVAPLASSVVTSGGVRFTLTEVPADVPFVQLGLSDGVTLELRPADAWTFPPF